ncbi:MAG: DUF5678 domain-containing protein [Bryobacteraceae bacterium]
MLQNQAEYAGLWVALDDGKLICSGDRAKQVLESAIAQGYKPVLVRVPEVTDVPFGGW